MLCNPAVVLDRSRKKPKISVILIDWGARESFHSLDYFRHQTADREDYELIWLEFYDRRPERLAEKADALDRWIVCGYPEELIYHKHRLYNLGILAARGEVCVICDSDAIYRPTFIESLIRAFEQTPDGVVHLDEVRNNDEQFYPFNYPSIDDVLGVGCVNWRRTVSLGLLSECDRIHRANYGACLAARRRDLLAIGGADEHLDYLGYICGPYDLTFRLVNYHGRPERWLRDEYLYHVWHPNTSGVNSEYHGPHDGMMMSLLALDARASFRIKPVKPSPLLQPQWQRTRPKVEQLIDLLSQHPEPSWQASRPAKSSVGPVYWVERDRLGFNVFCHECEWFALPFAEGRYDPAKAWRGEYRLLLQGGTQIDVLRQIADAVLEREALRGGLLGGMVRRLRSEPLSHLPYRIWRKARRAVSYFWTQQPPWETTRS